MLSIVEKSQKLNGEFSNSTGFKEFMKIMREVKKLYEENNNETEKRTKILTDLEKAQLALLKAQSQEAVELQKIRVETQELNKANKEQAKDVLGMISPYQRFAKEVSEAKKNAKNLGAEMIELEQSFKRGEISKREYNAQLKKLSAEFVEAKVKASGLDQQIKKLDNSVGDNQRNVGNYKSAIGGLTSSFRNLLAAFGVVGAIDMFADLMRSSFETVKQLNSQNTALKEIFQTESQVAYQKEFLSDITNKYGLELVSTTDAYKGYSAAIKDTTLEGEKGRMVFESFSGASAKLGLNMEQQKGIFLALEQMISKGKVSAEELRGQLGERMPGAFKLFADSIGVSTMELDKMLKEGKVISSEVLPKVAERLQEVYNLENSGNIDNLAAAQNRLKNEWTSFLTSVAGDKDIINSLADGIDVLGDVLKFALDVLIVDGEDGASVLGDLIDIVTTLVGTFGDMAEGLGLLDEEQKNNLFSLQQFKGDLIAIQSVISVVSGGIKYLAETISNFFSTMFQDDGWSKFIDKMENSADRFLKVIGKYNEAQAEAKAVSGKGGEGDVYLLNEKKKTEEYKNAWDQAKKAKQSYFQLNGKYFNTSTGKNTGKSVDDYIDQGTQLIAKQKATPYVAPTNDKAAKSKADKAQKDAEREAEKRRKIALANAKAEIEAQKLALEFMLKSFDEENKLTQEKVVFYQNYYDQRFALLEKEKNLELSSASSSAVANKIRAKFKLEQLELEKAQQEKLKQIRVQSTKDEQVVYEIRNQSILSYAIEFTDKLVENEKNRIDKISELEIKALNEKTRLNEKDVQAKFNANQELTHAETEYLNEIVNIHQKNASQKLQINDEYYNQTRKHLENALALEQAQRGEYFDTDTNMQIAHENSRYTIEIDSLIHLLEQKKITQQEYDEEAEIAEAEHQNRLNEIRQEAFNRALELQSEFVDNVSEIKKIESGFAQLQNATTTEDYMKGLSDMSAGLKSFAKEGSTTWKALAIFQASLNMFLGISEALKEKNLATMVLRIALATTTGVMALSRINATPNPKYEHGTLWAERSTMAITDEKGPELHFDKNWKLKDKGSKGGPRFKPVTVGDKIIPADLSKLIMEMSSPATIIEDRTSIDSDEIAIKVGREFSKVLENQKKEHFLTIDGKLVRIESSKNTRIIYHDSDEKPTGQRLQ